MDRNKLRFAFWVIGVCGAVAVGLAVFEFCLPREGATLAGVIDMLKLIATTALGFVFGRSLGNGDK